MIKYPLYLVPYDFSPVAENALEMSIDLAKKNEGSIYMLNVAKANSDVPRIRHQFSQVVEKLSKEDRRLITSNVTVGNLYDDVEKAISILRPSLVVIGTHGAKGLQKIFGSYIEKIVNNSESPLLVTQGDKSLENVKNIVMSFNFTRESLQITKFAARMAKKFGACIHLVGQHDNNDAHEAKINTNIVFAKRYMEENSIKYKIANLPHQVPFGKEMIHYADQVNADIIAATFPNKDHIIHTANVFMQNIIENSLKVPVLTINEEHLSTAHY